MNQSSSLAPAASLVDRWVGPAQQWLRRDAKIPGLRKLSTTQKVVGGTLLAVGIGYWARRKSGSKSAKRHGATAATLHELLLFVNDRIAGYEHAVAESKDPQLRGYYHQLVSQSQQFATDLNTRLTREGGSRESSTTLKGKLYRSWMDTKAALTGNDEKAILASNIYGEEWALKAYEDALADQTLRRGLRRTVQRQFTLSQSTYKQLQKLADHQ